MLNNIAHFSSFANFSGENGVRFVTLLCYTTSMTREEFEAIIVEELPKAVPEYFRGKIKNIAFLVADEPSEEVRREHYLTDDMTLLGLYRGVPLPLRGDNYGIGMTLPDTIELYQKSIEAAAGEDPEDFRRIVRETLWHEVGHYFGLSDEEIEQREDARI